jgi:hypothetical protein
MRALHARVPRASYALMNSDRVIADAIKAAQRLLWHTYDLPDAMTVVRLRKFVCSPTVQSALQRTSDTLLAFTLRAVEVVIADQSRTDREMIRRLWDILLNNPHLIQAMWPQDSPFGPTWLSLRPAPGYVGTPKVMARR